ncbi:MAG: signal recognition particle-docking protein FtsY [Candidatus Poseidoniaceae archaeon]|jgi:fused signal recognition particle receptor|nr:signal recognition particle-docking protein FtsY [Candidatus Poseidoniaceae archaeon]
MGLFDKFRKKVHDAVSEVDINTISSEETSNPNKEATSLTKEEFGEQIPNFDGEDYYWGKNEEDEEEFDEEEETTHETQDDDWEEWDDEEINYKLPTKLSRKERKILARENKKHQRLEKTRKKELKRRKGVEVEKLAGSKVNLNMMRTTTGRQLVKVKESPTGSAGAKQTDGMSIDLGGGIVEKGGRIVKENEALTNLLEELEWIMLESDISSDAVTSIITALKTNLVGQRLRKGANLSKVLEASLKRALRSILKAGYWDFDATIKKYIDERDKPVVVMFVGVNGTGKTTTAAKIAHRLKQSGHTVIAAAGDTFRAGAIEQLESHCKKLEIKCISSQRGGDSAAIARDAIESAKSKDIDVVLVDTAGRMQNKANLMAELEKVRRVANPHLTLFVGDALAGNDAVDQAKSFQEMLKFDGAILTKLDTDAKGGAGLSIAHTTGRPIVLCGMGQGYDDLIQFDPDWLLNQLFD